MTRTIDVDLFNPASIQSAIEQVEQIKASIKEKTNQLIEQLVATGVEIAQAKVAEMDAVFTGNLQGSIAGLFDASSGVGLIIAEAPYAIYVEYGTGMVGSAHPHPEGKGYRSDGWWWYDEIFGKWQYTEGMAARPFMFETAREIQSLAPQIVAKVFA